MHHLHHHHHHHRDASPVQLEDLPESFHAVNVSPPPASTGCPLPVEASASASASASTSRSSSVIGVKRDASVSVDCRDCEEEKEVEHREKDESRSRGRADGKGKGRAIDNDNDIANANGDTSMDESDAALPAGSVLPGIASHSSNSSASAPVHRPHHPQNHDSLSTSGANVSFGPGGFGVKGPPGGDCKRVCLRHQRMVDAGARVDLQKQLEKFPEVDQQTANTIWSLFSSSSGAARLLTLRGLLTICCPSQLSFLSENLKAECRLDPFAVLPREIALKCMTFLDAVSLGRAAQVSKSWKALADDDLLWRTMCEQHIERKCEKCGWGLPLLEKKRKQKQRDASGSSSSRDASQSGRAGTSSIAVPRADAASYTAADGSMASTSTAQALARYENSQHNHTPLPKSLEEALAQAVGPGGAGQSTASIKRPRLAQSTSNMQLADLTLVSAPPSPKYGPPAPGQDPRTQQNNQSQSQAQAQAQLQLQAQAQTRAQSQAARQAPTRPWKSVYCERLAIARNWARGKCSYKTLKGHTDAITCLQIDDSLHDVPYPVLMTGSWDRTVRIWNAETGVCISELRGHTRGVRCIQFDSAKLISGGMDSTLKIWSWRTGQCIRTLEGHRDSVISLCFDKHVLASGSADSTIKVWNFNTAECFTLRGHREWVNQVRIWSPASTDCSVTPANLAEPGGGPAAQDSSASMPPVKLLFSASDDGTIKLWDLVTRQCLRTLEGHVAQVQCLKIISVTDQSANQFPVANEDSGNSFINPSEQSSMSSASSAEAAAAAAAARNRSQVVPGNGYAGFFDAQQAAPGTGLVPASQLPIAAPSASAFLAAAARPPPDPSTLPFVDFGTSPAPLVVSGSLDNTIKLWNIDDAKCARTLFGHIEGVWDVDMDQLRIVSASHDRTIKIWDRNSGKCLHTLVGHRGAVTSLALGDDKIISGSDDCTIRIWSFAKQ